LQEETLVIVNPCEFPLRVIVQVCKIRKAFLLLLIKFDLLIFLQERIYTTTNSK